MILFEQMLSRRSFLAFSAAAAASPSLRAAKKVPVGLEMFSVRDQLKADLPGTVKAVAKIGYQDLEFFSPYYDWTPAQAKDVRKLMDDAGIRCVSTHNGPKSFSPEGIDRAIELNQILGSKMIIMASAGKVTDADGWKGVADRLTAASAKLKTAGMRNGFHNHQFEFMPLPTGEKPIEILAKNTPKEVILQLDVGTVLYAKQDPVAWIKANPGRIVSMHLKDWSPDPGKGFEVMFGEGSAPWKKIFEAAEEVGGIESYLIEQEGGSVPPMETAARCLANFKKIHS